jgi:hypothetical protein
MTGCGARYGRPCSEISRDNPTAGFWSQQDVPATIIITWGTSGGPRTPAGPGGKRVVMPPAVNVLISLTDSRIVDANRPFNTGRSITPVNNDERHAVKVRLRYGGDVVVRYSPTENAPLGTQLQVCFST